MINFFPSKAQKEFFEDDNPRILYPYNFLRWRTKMIPYHNLTHKTKLWKGIIIPFDPHNYLKFKDYERCPHKWDSFECAVWCKKDDERLLLIALDRYADFLQGVKNDSCI